MNSDASAKTMLPSMIASDGARDGRLELGSFGFISIVNVLLRHRVTIVIGSLVFSIPAFILSITSGHSYTSTSRFMLQEERASNSGLSSLAEQFGVAVGSGAGAQSPALYADLVTSRSVLTAVAAAKYDVPVGGEVRYTSLYDAWRRGSEDSLTTSENAIRALRKVVTATLDQRTGIITVSVTAASPKLAQEIATQSLSELTRFNLDRRQSQAAAERRFTEAQTKEAEVALRSAEDSLQDFLQHNRAITAAPDLKFRQDRMDREVARRAQLFSALSQSYEQARIEEVRDIPALTIIEAPTWPAYPDSRGTVTRTVIAFVLGALLGAAIALVRALMFGAPESDDIRELSSLVRATLDDALHPIRAIRRRAIKGGRARA